MRSAQPSPIVTVDQGGTARVWDVSWAVNIHGEELVRRVCAERLIGTSKFFNDEDVIDPILKGLSGTNVCERANR